MTRHETLGAIVSRLPELTDDTLESLLEWLRHEDDAFEGQLRKDVEAGKLDTLIAEAMAEHEAGETMDFEASCDETVLETVPESSS